MASLGVKTRGYGALIPDIILLETKRLLDITVVVLKSNIISIMKASMKRQNCG
jgi:hypothetical protein